MKLKEAKLLTRMDWLCVEIEEASHNTFHRRKHTKDGGRKYNVMFVSHTFINKYIFRKHGEKGQKVCCQRRDEM